MKLQIVSPRWLSESDDCSGKEIVPSSEDNALSRGTSKSHWEQTMSAFTEVWCNSYLTESWWARLSLMETQTLTAAQPYWVVFNLKVRRLRSGLLAGQSVLGLFCCSALQPLANPLISRPSVSLLRIDFCVSRNQNLSPLIPIWRQQ